MKIYFLWFQTFLTSKINVGCFSEKFVARFDLELFKFHCLKPLKIHFHLISVIIIEYIAN